MNDETTVKETFIIEALMGREWMYMDSFAILGIAKREMQEMKADRYKNCKLRIVSQVVTTERKVITEKK